MASPQKEWEPDFLALALTGETHPLIVTLHSLTSQGQHVRQYVDLDQDGRAGPGSPPSVIYGNHTSIREARDMTINGLRQGSST